jgi:NAD(P)-dependent dehydrogenase (short-subunit alcohol dehydrogenase family)
VIAGGLGGLGRSIARWIVKRGARNLILLSRSGPKTESAKTLVKDLAAQGAHVTTPACDITNKLLLKAVLHNCTTTLPPVKGCIQASMVLKVSSVVGV